MEVDILPKNLASSGADTTPLDEQLARELHAQLNDPQNVPPLTRRRTRKAPSFYTPQAGGGSSMAEPLGADSADLASPGRSSKRQRDESSAPAPQLVPTKSQEQRAPDASTLSHSAKRAKSHLSDVEASPFVNSQHEPKSNAHPGSDAQPGPESPRSPGQRSRGSAKLPKLPMVRKGSKWYRGRLLKDGAARVLIEVSALEEPASQEWLPKDSERLWRGSYKGKDWRYLGDGAWEPRARSCQRSSIKAAGSSNSTDDQVRLTGASGIDTAGQPCLRCKTSSGTTQETSQGSKDSSSDRSSLAEDLFESQGAATPASHLPGKQQRGPFNEETHPTEEIKPQPCHREIGLQSRFNEHAEAPDEPSCQLHASTQPDDGEPVKVEAADNAETAHATDQHAFPHGTPGSVGDQEDDKGDSGNGTASGLHCEEALPEDDLLAGKAADSPSESMREGQSHAAGSSLHPAGNNRRASARDGASGDERKPHAEPLRRNFRKRGMKRPRMPLPEEAEEDGYGEDGDRKDAPAEQQTIRASSRIRTPAMKAEDSDFILTHELGRKAPRLADFGDGPQASIGRRGGGRKGNRSRKGLPGVSLPDQLSDGQDFGQHPSDSVMAQHGGGRKARRGGLAKGGQLPPGMGRRQGGSGMRGRESGGGATTPWGGTSLGTLIQALQAHEHKTAAIQQSQELAAAASTSQHNYRLQPQLFTGTGSQAGPHNLASSPPNLGPLMVPQILAVAPEVFISCGQHAMAQQVSACAEAASAPKTPPVPLFV